MITSNIYLNLSYMKKILSFVKRLLGENLTNKIRPLGHGIKANIASIYYKNPAKKLKIIGITGTKGKTTTTTIAGRLGNLYGLKTGYISTAVINTGDIKGEFLNPYKMTSIDSFAMQKYLSEMVKNGCETAILEMSSQGLEQNRHVGLSGFDEVIFLNIYPEHIEAHGGWDNYVGAKSILFQNLRPSGVFIGNGDFPETDLMYAAIPKSIEETTTQIRFSGSAIHSSVEDDSLFRSLVLGDTLYPTNFTAKFDIANCFVAILAIANISIHEKILDAKVVELAGLLKDIYGVPGRMEWVMKSGQTNELDVDNSLANTSIVVDYAHEPASMEQLLQTTTEWKQRDIFQTLIHIVSCDGAGRDDWKKPILADLSHKYADFSIYTTDNYDNNDNPQEIINLMTQNVPKKDLEQSCFKFINRKDAMSKALEIAKSMTAPTLIVSTGVGSEQGLTQPEGTIEWDERDVWRELVQKNNS
jgi:UDP-N-acetylmuramoyl-L-alanyl-D-glutamate--2,6-diaminopimelate ligase